MQLLDYLPCVKRSLSQECVVREDSVLIHALLGMQTELGELFDIHKTHIFYRKAVDQTNLAEEIGDFFYYFTLYLDEVGMLDKVDDIIAANIKKLSARYPDGFSKTKAIERDIEKEMAYITTQLSDVCKLCGEPKSLCNCSEENNA